MSDYLLAEVAVVDPQSCHIVSQITDGWTLTEVSRSALSGEDGEVVDEFTLRNDADADPPLANADATQQIFSFEDEHIFRISRPPTQGCACQRIESEGCVVQNINGDDESLTLTFLVDGTDTLRKIVGELDETAETVRLRRLVEQGGSHARNAPKMLDLSVLTARQKEALEVAYDMGYFEKPRDATAGEVADELDIATTTFSEHLVAAQRKLLTDLLDA